MAARCAAHRCVSPSTALAHSARGTAYARRRASVRACRVFGGRRARRLPARRS
jgi:hypothetical protein